MITPTININGSSADDLIQPRMDAYAILREAKILLQQVTPNGRDYPGDVDKCVADREAHYARLSQINQIMAEIIAEAVNIKEQIK
jgi:hypothetical protein